MISFHAEEHLTFDHNSQTVVALLLLSCAVSDVFPVNAGVLLDYFFLLRLMYVMSWHSHSAWLHISLVWHVLPYCFFTNCCWRHCFC